MPSRYISGQPALGPSKAKHMQGPLVNSAKGGPRLLGLGPVSFTIFRIRLEERIK